MKRPKTLALVLAAALVTTAAMIALLVERPEGSREVGSGARGGGRDLVSPDRPANRAGAPKPGRTFGPNRARRRRQQRNLNETARALASELRLPEQRVKRALIDVRRRRFEARLEERIEKIRRSERRARRTPRRAREQQRADPRGQLRYVGGVAREAAPSGLAVQSSRTLKR